MPKKAQNGFATKKNESQYKWHRNDNTDEKWDLDTTLTYNTTEVGQD